jgi:hypothetical protein
VNCNPNAFLEFFSILVEHTNHEFNLESGHVPVPNSNKVVAVTIVSQVVQKNIQVKARGSVKLEFLTSIKYSKPIQMEQYTQERNIIRDKAIDVRLLLFNFKQIQLYYSKYFLSIATFKVIIFDYFVSNVFLAYEKSSCETTQRRLKGRPRIDLAAILAFRFQDK